VPNGQQPLAGFVLGVPRELSACYDRPVRVLRWSVAGAIAVALGCELAADIHVYPADGCAATSVDEGAGLFVSTTGTASGCDASCTRADPCHDLRDAICVATKNDAGKDHIYVASGSYTGSVDVANDRPIWILGGWDTSFDEMVCGATITPTSIQGDDGRSAISILGDAGCTLANLDVTAGAAPSGGSSYALFVSTNGSPTVTLTDCTFTAARGSDGDAGAPGAIGAPGSDAGCAGDPTAQGQGHTGVPGDAGAPGLLGVYDENGYHPIVAGTGGVGASGGEGAPGGEPDVLCCFGPGCGSLLFQNDGAAGVAGCGAGGGNGGTGGGGGGGSFALYVWNAKIVASGCTLTAGVGGVGGAGGNGGASGAPTAGSDGLVAGPCRGYVAPNGTTCPDMSLPGECEAGTTLAGGLAGGPGGLGGAGGVGGAGATGPSCAIVFGGNAEPPSVNAQCTFVSTTPTACNGASGGCSP
jgi:hypothetical protein